MATLTKQEILDITAEYPIDFGGSARSALAKAPTLFAPLITANGIKPITDNGPDHEFMNFLTSGDFLDIELPCGR